MNPTIYKQLDSRWSSKPYPTYASSFGGNGCGCCACVHVAMEQESKADWNPETLRPWMVNQGYAYVNQGTTWNGITETLKYIGHKNVVRIWDDPMSEAWKELDKGNRIGVLLVDNSRTPDGTYWTSSGHYVAFTDYRKDSNGHWFFIKDSGGRNHDGWYCYEKSIKGALPKLWIVERIGTQPTPPSPSGGEHYNGAYPVVKYYLEPGDRGENVTRLQNYLNWYTDGQFFRECGGADGVYGKNTLRYVNKMLTDFFGASEADGKVGNKTIAKMKAYTKPIKPQPTPTTYTTVIDVSAFQDAINWASVKASGVVGAMVRCGYRGYETGKLNEDSMFLDHIKGAYNAGLKVGVYFFTEAINWAEGKEEAEYTMKLIEKSGVTLYYPIAIDTEAQSASSERAKHLSVAQRTDAIKGFCETIKERGGVPMIYASTNWFENKLDMSKLPYDCWCAQYYKECQYKGKVVMWQYTSEGSVSGVKGVVDMNKCYITSASPMPTPTPQPTPTPSGGYTGSFPTEDEIKAASNQGVINRSVAWAKDIARQGFDYLMPQSAGCYFCGTTKKKAYTCMPFVTAMFAHGGGDADVLSLCKNKHSFSLRNEDSDWQMLIRKGKFAYLGRMSGIDWSAIKVGDVLVQYASDDLHGHMMMYAGNNELAEASPDIGCAITSGAKSRYSRYARGESQCGEGAKNFVMRYVGTRSYMSKGESGTAVLEWQDYLDWWSDGAFYKECGKGDGVFGSNTDKWTKAFQTAVFGASEADGTVGMKTIAKAKEIRK